MIRQELKAYAPELCERPELVCMSKADLVPDASAREELGRGLRGPRWISAVSGEGIQELLQALGLEVARS